MKVLLIYLIKNVKDLTYFLIKKSVQISLLLFYDIIYSVLGRKNLTEKVLI